MRTLRLMFLVPLLLVSMSLSAAEPAKNALSAKSFQFRFKDAARAASLIRAALSKDGSVSLQPGTNTLIVTDHNDNVREVSRLLAKYDVPAQTFKLTIRLVDASRVASGGKTGDDVKDVAAKLSGILKFNNFEKLGEISVEAKEGDPLIVDTLAPGYRADLRVGDYDPASDSLRLSDFRLQRVEAGKTNNAALQQLLKTSLNLRLGQLIMVGAARGAQSDHALMLVLTAKRP